MQSINKESSILNSANLLFIQQGYTSTTMRDISTHASVSLGLICYYYKSKRQLAIKILNIYLNYLKHEVSKFINPEDNPMLHSATVIRIFMGFFLSHPCRQFYMECLENDVYMEAIQSLGTSATKSIAKATNSDISNDMLLLYDNYIPPCVEKILLTQKKQGNFKTIDYEEIPSIVFSLSVERLVTDRKKIDAIIEKSIPIANKILQAIPFDITNNIIDFYTMQL